MQELYDYPLSIVKKQQASSLYIPSSGDFSPSQQEIGEALPSFILTQLEQGEEGDEDLKGAAATMFGAGELTVVFEIGLWQRHLNEIFVADLGYTCRICSRNDFTSRMPGQGT
jgi:hypothetical protein